MKKNDEAIERAAYRIIAVGVSGVRLTYEGALEIIHEELDPLLTVESESRYD